MQIIVQSYLSKHYEIATSEVGNDGIYLKSDTREHRIPTYGDKLVKELVTIFCLEDGLLKTYIDDWAVSIKKDIDLEFYWKTQEEIAFPHISRVISSLMANDIVAVEPLAAPRGELLYMDYQYSAGTPNINGRVYDRQDMNDAIRRWENVIDRMGELDHPNNLTNLLGNIE
jgi:hypothetical protein